MGVELSERSGAGHQEGVSETSIDLSQEALFEVLSNSRRRMVLQFLLDSKVGEEIELSELTRTIAARENGVPIHKVSSAQHQRVYTSLYQTHIPKLDQHDIVRFDQNEVSIRPTERVLVFDDYLSSNNPADGTLSHVWLVLSSCALVFLLLGWGGLIDLGSDSAYLIAILVTGAVFLVSVLQYAFDIASESEFELFGQQ